MQFPGWAQRAHPDYATMAAAPDSRYSCLMPWGLRATTRAYRLELGGAIARFTTEAVTVIDAMANVGCDSAHFLRMFPAKFNRHRGRPGDRRDPGGKPHAN